jgi:hypothetical protein
MRLANDCRVANITELVEVAVVETAAVQTTATEEERTATARLAAAIKRVDTVVQAAAVTPIVMNVRDVVTRGLIAMRWAANALARSIGRGVNVMTGRDVQVMRKLRK